MDQHREISNSLMRRVMDMLEEAKMGLKKVNWEEEGLKIILAEHLGTCFGVKSTGSCRKICRQ